MARSLNPYIAGNPVGNSNAFIGRADIVREVLHIFARREENALVLYGQRRIGKTSVLQFLKKTLAQETATGHYFPVYFDLQDKATFALGDVLKDLASTIANELGFPAPELGDNPEHVFQYEWLPQQLEKLAKGAASVLLFDEFDVLAAESAKGAGADFFPYLRKLIASDRQRLNFVFVIGRNVNDLNTIALSLFKGITARRVSLLGKEDTFALIRLAEKTSPLRWSSDALERIWQLTNGHAFFTQQLCSFAWEEAYDDGDFVTEEISASVVERVIDDALGAARHAFEWLWDGLPPAERVVSAALAQAGGKAVTETELEKLLHESGVRIVIRELQDAPKLLQEWDLLEPVDGGFRFRVELLRRWVEENKPLRRVQDELDRIEPVAESLFQAAQGLYRNSQLEIAENLLRQAIGINPNHVKANKLLADIFLAGSKYAEAKELLAALYEYQPMEARSRLIQALLGLASSLTTGTIFIHLKLNCYEEILKIDPNQSEAKKAYTSILEEVEKLSPINFEPKSICCFVLDTSGSMSGEPIKELNKGLQEFHQEIKNDVITARRLEVAVVSFNSHIDIVQEPALVEDFIMPNLNASGTTRMVDGVREAIALVEKHKQWYKQTGQPYLRPWIILITDGTPDSGQDINGLAKEIREGVSKKAFVFLQ